MNPWRPPQSQLQNQPQSQARPRAGTLGILYAEDFGIEAPAPPPAAPEPKPPALTQADIDAACLRAVAVAKAAWQGHAEERRATAWAKVTEDLAACRHEAHHHAETVADGVARTALGMIAGALPHLCRAHGDHEVRALMGRLTPLLAARTRLVVRVHPGLVPALQADIDTLDETTAANIELRPANLPPGDVRLSWEDGSLVRDCAAIRTAMQDGLAQLGLIDLPPPDPKPEALLPSPLPAPENRSLAFAE